MDYPAVGQIPFEPLQQPQRHASVLIFPHWNGGVRFIVSRPIATSGGCRISRRDQSRNPGRRDNDRIPGREPRPNDLETCTLSGSGQVHLAQRRQGEVRWRAM